MGNMYMVERIVCDTLTIGGLTEYSLSENVASQLMSGSSQLHPHHLAIGGVAPVIRCTTLDVKTVCDAAYGSSRIIPHIPIALAAPMYIYLTQVADGGTRTGGSNNIRLIINKGVLVPTSIGASGMLATLSFEIYCDGNSSGYAIETGTGVALPAGSGGPAATWRIGAIINNADASNTIRRVRTFSVEHGIRVSRASAGSYLEPLDSSVDYFAPSARFETEALKSVMDWTGVTRGAAAGAGFRFVLAPYTAGGIGFSTSGCISFDFLAGSMIVPETIGLDNGAGSTISCSVIGIGLQTGFTTSYRPMGYSTGVTCPADSADAGDSQRFGPGPCYDNSTVLTEVTGGSINFGNRVETYGCAAFPWPVKGCISEQTPTFNLTGINGDFYETLIGTLGRAVSTIFKIFLRKHTADGHGIADATASHIRISFTAGLIIPAGLGGAHLEMQRYAINVVKSENAALGLNTAIAIS